MHGDPPPSFRDASRKRFTEMKRVPAVITGLRGTASICTHSDVAGARPRTDRTSAYQPFRPLISYRFLRYA